MNHTTAKPTRANDPKHAPPANDSVAEDSDGRPSAKQLAYLRALADRTGQTFTYPRTARQASAEIRRLQTQQRSVASSVRSSESRSPTRSPANPQTPPASTSTARQPATDLPPPGAERSNPMSTPTIPRRPDHQLGERVELARGTSSAAAREFFTASASKVSCG